MEHSISYCLTKALKSKTDSADPNQIWSFTVLPFTTRVLTVKSTPMVVIVSWLKVSSTYLLIREVFPDVWSRMMLKITFYTNSLTASPMRTILKMKSNLNRVIKQNTTNTSLRTPVALFQTLLAALLTILAVQGAQRGTSQARKPLFGFTHL